MNRQARLKEFATGLALFGLLACASAKAQLITLHAEGTVDLLLAIQFQHFQNGDPITLDIVFDGSSTATDSAGNERLFANAVSLISLQVADYAVSGTGTLSLFDDQPLQDFNGPPPVLDLFSVRGTRARAWSADRSMVSRWTACNLTWDSRRWIQPGLPAPACH